MPEIPHSPQSGQFSPDDEEVDEEDVEDDVDDAPDDAPDDELEDASSDPHATITAAAAPTQSSFIPP